MNSVGISVVIPSAGSGHTLKRAVLSAVNQTFAAHEIIVVRNSTEKLDETLVEELRDQKITLFDLGKPIGAASARNYGVNFANSEFIAFLDDDDEWFESKLNLQIDFMLKLGLDASTTNYIFCKGNKSLVFPEQLAHTVPRDISLRCHCGPGSTLLISRNSFMNIGMFDSNLLRYEDWIFMVDLQLSQYKYQHLDIVTAKIDRLDSSWHLNNSQLKFLKLTIRKFEKLTFRNMANGILFEEAVLAKRRGDLFSMILLLLKWLVTSPRNVIYCLSRTKHRAMIFFLHPQTKGK